MVICQPTTTGKWCASLFALMILLSGCAAQDPEKPRAKAPQKSIGETAAVNWNRARAAVMVSLAKSQYTAGNFDECRETVAKGLKLNPENSDLHVINAKLAIEDGQLEVADRELELALRFGPANAEAEYLSGVVYQRWGKLDMALDCYIRASQKAPTEPAYFLARAEMLVALDRSNEALSLLMEKITTFDQNAALRDAAGQLLVEQGRYAEAVAMLRQASNLEADDDLIREHLAMAYYFNRQYREALATFERLVADDSNAKRSELWLAMGECQMHLAQPADARTSFDKACKLSPSSPKVWMSHAKAAMQLGDTRRAELSLQKAMSLDPDSGEVRLMLGYLRVRQNRMNDALAQFQQAAKLDPRDPMALCMIGYVMEQTGRPQVAIKFYAQALKLKPDDELATKLMASVSADE